jgi:protein gp37
MGSKTNIEWCDSTVNPTTGCDGCELWAGDVRACYAGNLHESRLALTLPQLYAENFTDVRLAPGRMAAAAGWSDLRGKSSTRQAGSGRTPPHDLRRRYGGHLQQGRAV